MVAIIRRVARLGASNITHSLGDVATFDRHAPVFVARLAEAVRLWHDDSNKLMTNMLVTVAAAGAVLLAVLVIIALMCFASMANSLGKRTTSTLEAFMVIPQSVANAMRGRSAVLLEKALAEADSAEFSESSDGNDGDFADDEGLDADNEAAERLRIINEVDNGLADDGSNGFSKVLQAASKQ